MVNVTVKLNSQISASATFNNRMAAQVAVVTSVAICPTIDQIDGGDSGDDTQFSVVNGVLDGGGA